MCDSAEAAEKTGVRGRLARTPGPGASVLDPSLSGTE